MIPPMHNGRIPAFLASVIVLLVATPASAALLGRAPATPGGGDFRAYYDTVLGVTWAADANLATTSGYDADGRMTWSEANAWIATLNQSAYLGLTGWRMPLARPLNGTSYTTWCSTTGQADCGSWITAPGTLYAGSTATEMPNLFYGTLGNPSYQPLNGSDPPTACSQTLNCLLNPGPFTFPQVNPMYGMPYWTASPAEVINTEDGPVVISVMTFNFMLGQQTGEIPGSQAFAWAVRDGDPLAVVPVPAAAWLFGSALAVVGWLRRRVTD